MVTPTPIGWAGAPCRTSRCVFSWKYRSRNLYQHNSQVTLMRGANGFALDTEGLSEARHRLRVHLQIEFGQTEKSDS